MNIPTLGEVYGVIEAWRGWRVDIERVMCDPRSLSVTYRLKSVSFNDMWPAKRPMESEDGRTVESKVAHGSGIYTLKEPEYALFHAGLPHGVLGRVAIWGDIIEHEKGYRSQYAYPIKLIEFPGQDWAALGKEYGVPVIQPSYELLAEAYKVGSSAQAQLTSFQNNVLSNIAATPTNVWPYSRSKYSRGGHQSHQMHS